MIDEDDAKDAAMTLCCWIMRQANLRQPGDQLFPIKAYEAAEAGLPAKVLTLSGARLEAMGNTWDWPDDFESATPYADIPIYQGERSDQVSVYSWDTDTLTQAQTSSFEERAYDWATKNGMTGCSRREAVLAYAAWLQPSVAEMNAYDEAHVTPYAPQVMRTSVVDLLADAALDPIIVDPKPLLATEKPAESVPLTGALTPHGEALKAASEAADTLQSDKASREDRLWEALKQAAR